MLVTILLITSSLAGICLLTRTIWALGRFAYRPVKSTNVTTVPTISVCIAARNETHALTECLERVLKSDYPKLEILVLDDSSSDDTSLIIKSFAHAGVRFVAGSHLPDGWLGKNHAYQTLIQESSGEYILFLDVDTTIGSTSITQLMEQLLVHDKAMLSVLPRRNDTQHVSALIGTMRYYWELLLGTSKSPPAASAIWIVRRTMLIEAGVGLNNYSMSIRPERHLARQLQRKKLYYYLIGTQQLEIGFEKRLSSQYETALRLYYPMSGRTSIRWFVSSLFLLILLTPLLVGFIMWQNLILSSWSWLVTLIVATAFGLFTARTYGGTLRIVRILLGPFLVLQELALLFISHLTYRRGKVTWKGRSVHAQPNNHDAIQLSE